MLIFKDQGLLGLVGPSPGKVAELLKGGSLSGSCSHAATPSAVPALQIPRAHNQSGKEIAAPGTREYIELENYWQSEQRRRWGARMEYEETSSVG